MKTNRFGEMIFDEASLCDLVMSGHNVQSMPGVIVTPDLDLQRLCQLIDDPEQLLTWSHAEESDISLTEFDQAKQNQWFMPDEYRDFDIAAHVLSLCQTQEQLQRAGRELLLFQQHDLFDLLRYLRYLVDVMTKNNVIWGVGRGSSVASYVLYKLGVHRIDSMYYDLDPEEFIR